MQIIDKQSEIQRDRQAFLAACNAIDWSKEYTCIRCKTIFKVDRHEDAERYLKPAWNSHGEYSDAPDYYVIFDVPCPVCGRVKHILGNSHRQGIWLDRLIRERNKGEVPKNSFFRRLFSHD